MKEILFAVRMLCRNAGLTAVITLLLGLGIGAVSTSYSFFHTVLHYPLQYAQPDHLVCLWTQVPGFSGSTSFSAPNFLDWQAQNHVFSAMAAGLSDHVNLFDDSSEPSRVSRNLVSAGYFDLLGLRAAQGRTFRPEESQPGHEKVVVLNHDFWRRQFGSSANLLGQSVQLDGVPHRIVGIMPAFRGYDNPDLWTPLELNPRENRGHWWLTGIARLKPGVTLTQARAEMEIISQRLEKEHPDTNTGLRTLVNPMNRDRFGDMYEMVQYGSATTLTAVGLLLFIACMNIANLLLARHASREKEIAIRAALGCSRAGVIRQLMLESLLLGGLGGLLGLLFTNLAVQVLNAVFIDSSLHIDPIQINARVLWFVLSVALITSVLFGLAPAWQISRAQVLSALKDGGHGATVGARRQRLKRALVVAQVGLSALLLVCTGLLARSFINMMSINPGFKTDRLLTLSLSLTPRDYPDGAAQSRFFENVRERIQALPGVQTVGLNNCLPLGNGGNSVYGFAIEGRPAPPPGQGAAENFQLVSAGYFETMGIPIIKGRGFSRQDTDATQPVTVINEALARKYWPQSDALGARIQLAGKTRQIVGVVGDMRLLSLNEAPKPQMYLPHTQWPSDNLHLLVRTERVSATLGARIRQEIRQLDARQPLMNVRSMNQVIHDSVSLSAWRVLVSFMGVFAVLALFLASLGVYSVISYSVAQRTQEFGIRMALGAAAGDVVGIVLRQGLRLIIPGILLGTLAAVGAGRLLRTLLFGTSSLDALVFGTVSVVLFCVAILACYLPARRAARTNPLTALRYE